LAAVADSRLVWMQGEPIGHDPRRDLAQGGQGLRFRPAQDHEVVGVPHHPAAALFHQEVERMQIEIGQQRRDHSLNAKGNFRFERTILDWRSGFVLDLRRKG
jgi:hypothetical protein